VRSAGPGPPRRVPAPLVWLIGSLAACLLAAGGSPRAAAQARPARPHIFLITVDTLRASALGVYGYDRPTSPRIDAFAREAVVVTDAIAQAPYTKASMASMLTGLFPTSHKTYTASIAPEAIVAGPGRGATPLTTDVLPDELPTLAEALGQAGYRTIALVTNPFLIREFGFAQGFDVHRFFATPNYERAGEVLREAARHLPGPGSPPVFLWIHLMDPHNPYDPPEPYRSMFPPRAPPRLVPLDSIPPEIRLPDVRDLHTYRARYDAEVRSADEALGRFFGELRARRLWDSSVIVLTSDHGEEFLEHGGMGHNTSLYDEQLRVPLILRIPGVAPRVARMQAQLVDLFPTLARLAGARPPDVLHGGDLVPALEGRTGAERYAFAEIVGVRFALRTLEWKFTSSLQGGKQLFDLRTDPAERHNLSKDLLPRAAELEGVVARIVSMIIKDGERVQGRTVPIDPAVIERLRSLGYLSGPTIR
jgi:arylsulfatase A-like enzyme